MRRVLVLLFGLAWGSSVLAQESPDYRISDHVFNSGGVSRLTSSGYVIELSAVGEGLTATDLASAGYNLDGGFTGCYPPPGEVAPCGESPCPDALLKFTNKQTLTWPAERSAGVYNLYRDLLDNLGPPQHGSCFQQQIPGTTTVDATSPAGGEAYFYLVTAENRLAEEGVKGFDSAGALRQNLPPSACQ